MTNTGLIRKEANDFAWLLRGQLYSLRLQWFWYVIFMAFSPLAYLFFLWIYGGGPTAESRLYIVTGAMANGAVSSAMLSLGQTIGRLRDQNALEYYASLPVSKLSFIMALATRGVILSMPSSAIILALGSLSMGLDLAVDVPRLLLAYVIGAYSLAGLGAMIGFQSTGTESVGLVTQIVAPLIVLFAPVYVPLGQLPSFLQWTARFLPTTYVAACLRCAVWPEMPGSTYWSSLGISGLWCAIGLFVALKRAPWRGAPE